MDVAGRSPVAKKIRTLREQRGMSQRQLADAAGVGENVIFQLEAGNTQTPHHDNLVAIAQALRVDPLELKELAGMLTAEERVALERMPTFAEFVASRHLPLTQKQRAMLLDLYESWVGRRGRD